MKIEEALAKEIIEAVREDKRIGRGSCSTVDECQSDEDLIRDLEDVKNGFEPIGLKPGQAWTLELAMKWFLYFEDLHSEIQAGHDAEARSGM